MTKKILFASHAIPQKDISGAQIQMWAVMDEMIKRNYDITFLHLEQFTNEISNELQISRLLEDFPSIKIISLNTNFNLKFSFFHKVFTTKSNIFHSFKLKKDIYKKIYDKDFDFIFNYHYSAAAATYFIKNVPQVTITGDLLHSPIEARLELQKKDNNSKKISIFKRLRNKYIIYRLKKIAVMLLNSASISGSFGKSDSETLREMGVKKSKHYYAPVADSYKFLNKPKRSNNKKVKIITAVGDLNATSTYAGFQYVGKYIIPILKSEIPGQFELHVIGAGNLPSNLHYLKKMDEVFLRGYVDDVDHEFDTADILLLPTDVFIGFRTRIIKALCHELCLITHISDTINMPELKNEDNCFFGSDPETIGKYTILAVQNKKMRKKIAKNGRLLYEELYKSDISVATLLDDCEKHFVQNK